jgi:nitronate monooxygenase
MASPFALVREIRQFFDGTIVLSGAMSSGADVFAAQAIGADMAYIGTRFLATTEAHVLPEYKQMIVESARTTSSTRRCSRA